LPVPSLDGYRTLAVFDLGATKCLFLNLGEGRAGRRFVIFRVAAACRVEGEQGS
jgi:hypothetical protein